MKLDIKFNWKKKHIIFDGSQVPFKDFKSRTMLPKAIPLNNKTIRVFYTFITKKNQANCSYFDLDLKSLKVTNIYKKKILKLGRPGLFDDSGTLVSAICKYKEKYFLFYNGYKQTVVTPYSINVGLALSKNGSNFKKISLSPVLERNKFDPYFITGPFIMHDKDKFYCWYTSGMDWKKINGKYDSQYCIKYATSKDCINWNYTNRICLKNKKQAITAPSIFKHNNIYHMIFCYRSLVDFRNGKGSYKIGYAKSKNGITWKRNDKKINYPKIKEKDWNSLMQCYPSVIKMGNKILLFHNGNGFGETGIGMFIAEI